MGALAPQNLALAWLAARCIGDVSVSALADVSANVSMPGRMQQIQYRQRTLLLDVAHNPAGAEFLCTAIAQRQLQPALLVCGMLQDKDHIGVIGRIGAAIEAPWLLVDTLGERGMSAAQLGQSSGLDAYQEGAWEELVATANSATQPGDVILVFGSFNVIEQFALLDGA